MSAQNNNKDVIYVDIDDEITGLIDKVRSSEQKIVALVLPKRAAVLQSIVNMKLLKRTSDAAKKHIVLITSDPGLLPLAGTVGLHVAKTLQSKPEIPPAPGAPIEPSDDIDDALQDGDDSEAAETAADRSKPVGELAKSAPASALMPDDEDVIQMDDADLDAGLPPAAAPGKAKGKNKKLKVPNFNKFRLLIMLGGAGLVGLIVLLYVCIAVLPKATITIKTDSQAVSSNMDLTLDTAATTVKADAGVVPAQTQQSQKTLTQQVEATGQRNDGTKASGSIKISNCSDAAVVIPAGTGATSSSLTFITQTAIALAAGNFDSHGNCKSSGTHIGSVGVTAQQTGAQYNIGAGTFTVSGFSGVSASSSDSMSGGTDKITKVISSADIDNAKQKISAQDTNAVKQELQKALADKGLYAITGSLNAGTPAVTSSANVGDAADAVAVTEKITYTMFGAKRSDLQKIIENGVKDQIDTKKQKILDYGLDKAVFNLQNQQSATNAMVTMQVTAVAGSDLDTAALKKQVAGKKAADAKELIKANPGVTDVTVTYSPFWVSAIPNQTGKIIIQVEKPTTTNVKSKQ
ncbi:MAG TPA: hypothetical protein VMY99_02655 [Nevskiaceae bacterium]|nr:hypothetical protein [Nevskiaceae bacterium]